MILEAVIRALALLGFANSVKRGDDASAFANALIYEVFRPVELSPEEKSPFYDLDSLLDYYDDYEEGWW